jgi:decaprenylphospho-beta-D-ribofuranose 2-oxidase
VPAAINGLLSALDELDQEVAAAGGRLYLTKDSRQSAAMLQRTYPRLEEWRASRRRLDPRGVFASDLSRRLAI